MDIKKFAVTETGVLTLRDAADEVMMGEDNKPMTITLFGPGSREHSKATTLQTNRMIDKLKRKGKTDQTSDEKDKENADFFVACTKELSPNIQNGDLKGEALIRSIYTEKTLGFIPEQVGKFLQDWSSFKKPSTTI